MLRPGHMPAEGRLAPQAKVGVNARRGLSEEDERDIAKPLTRRGLAYTYLVLKDIAQLANTTSDFILIDSEDMSQVKVGICGPEGTPYHTGLFEVTFHLPKNYPLQPPKAKFVTQIFHPNIGTNGRVCVDVLDEKWSPSTTLFAACELIQALLRDPNPDSPLNVDAARMMDDPEMFQRTALLWTRHFANGSHTYDDFEEKLQIVAALKGNILEALKLLTLNHWDVQSACDKVL